MLLLQLLGADLNNTNLALITIPPIWLLGSVLNFSLVFLTRLREAGNTHFPAVISIRGVRLFLHFPGNSRALFSAPGERVLALPLYFCTFFYANGEARVVLLFTLHPDVPFCARLGK